MAECFDGSGGTTAAPAGAYDKRVLSSVAALGSDGDAQMCSRLARRVVIET